MVVFPKWFRLLLVYDTQPLVCPHRLPVFNFICLPVGKWPAKSNFTILLMYNVVNSSS